MLSAELQLEEKHRILAHLGQGGTSDVYLAVAQGPIGFNKLVVLKVLKKSLQSDPDFRDMFLVEARLAARLNHPNIVQTYEVMDDAGVATMVMEYLEGRPLSALARRAKDGELPLAVHLRIIADALNGLHYAHELTDFDGTPLGVVHRDFTPHNIFVTFEGQVKVLDFGIAKLSVSSVETRTGMVKGKIRYMSPEQILGRPVDRRADIYSAGVMLWQAATGVPLWREQADAAIMMQVAYGEIPAPETVVADVNPRLASVCKKALAFDPEARYATALELEHEIEEVIRELAGPASSREVGRIASELFVDVRQSTKIMIEQQLSGSVSRSWQGLRSPESGSFGLEEPSSRRDSRSATQRAPVDAPAAPSWRKVGAIVGGLCLLVLIVLFLGRPRDEAKGAATTPSAHPPVVAARASSAATSPVPQVQLRISARPSDTVLTLDGQALPSNPFEGHFPLDYAVHELKAQAKGYVSRVEHVPLDRDTTLELTLESAPERAHTERPHTESARVPSFARRAPAAAPAAAAPPAATPPPARAQQASSAVASANCEKPFFIDERGIKRMLPECL